MFVLDFKLASGNTSKLYLLWSIEFRMGLIGNGSVLLKSPAYLSSGIGSQCGHAANFHSSGRAKNRRWMFNTKSSFPDGYPVPYALKIATKEGGIASQTDISGVGTLTGTAISARISTASLSGSGSITNAALGQIVQASATLAGTGSISNADLQAISTLSASLTGSGSITTANLKSLVPLAATLAGSGSISANLKGTGRLNADIVPYTELSPEALANSVSAIEIETGYDLKEVLRLISAALSGKLSGGGTSTVTIRDINDTVDRIVATVDASGNRTDVTKDVS
jgi:hypothetical protein